MLQVACLVLCQLTACRDAGGPVRYSTPPGHAGTRVWCRVAGEDLLITARAARGAAEIARHPLSAPGSRRICDEHCPHHPCKGVIPLGT
jgi:hypothetical protein